MMPIPGETFVFTQFAGEPQVFLTESDSCPRPFQRPKRCAFTI